MSLNVWLVNVEDRVGVLRQTGQWYFRDRDAQDARRRLDLSGRYHSVAVVGPIACDIAEVSNEVVDDWCQRR